MAQALLAGVRVVDLAHDPGARAARILGDLGAEVVRIVPAAGDPLTGNVARAWNAGKVCAREEELDSYLAAAHVVFSTPGARGVLAVDPGRAPHAVWVSITPFGLTGPRAHWRASDLGVMASSGNMYCTGDPDRAPVRCSEPTAYAHSGPEAAFAAERRDDHGGISSAGGWVRRRSRSRTPPSVGRNRRAPRAAAGGARGLP